MQIFPPTAHRCAGLAGDRTLRGASSRWKAATRPRMGSAGSGATWAHGEAAREEAWRWSGRQHACWVRVVVELANRPRSRRREKERSRMRSMWSRDRDEGIGISTRNEVSRRNGISSAQAGITSRPVNGIDSVSRYTRVPSSRLQPECSFVYRTLGSARGSTVRSPEQAAEDQQQLSISACTTEHR